MVRMDIIKVNEKNKGVLVDDGESRNIAVMVEIISGASEADNIELMEEIKSAYTKYRRNIFLKKG